MVSKQDLAVIRQCLSAQQTNQQELLRQQKAFTQVISKLNTTLSKPLSVDVSLSDVGTRQVACANTSGNPDYTASGHLPDDKQVVGSVEKVWFPQLKILMDARIDTGAETASLDASEIQKFERDGDTWVRFKLLNRTTHKTQEFEKKVDHWVLIDSASSKTLDRRPVVELQVVIGGVTQFAEFNLNSRKGLNFPVLIGRNVLRDLMVVDVSKKFAAPLKRDVTDHE